MHSLERSDVALVVIDCSDGTVAQDRHIAGYAADAGKGVVIIANKWDLVSPEDRSDPETLRKIADAFDFVPGAPLLTVSATPGRNVSRVLDAAQEVADARAFRMPTGALNQVIRKAVDDRPPPFHKGRRLKVLYATQASTPTPPSCSSSTIPTCSTSRISATWRTASGAPSASPASGSAWWPGGGTNPRPELPARGARQRQPA